MLYILCGSDGTGKSTCFDMLKMCVDGIFVKESYTSSNDEKAARVGKVSRLLKSGKTVVYDRATILDDFVYSKVKENKESFFRTNSSLLDEIIETLKDVKIIYFTCSDDEIKRRLDNRGDDYVTVDDVPAIKNQYKKVFGEFGIVPFVVDTTNRSPQTVAAQVLSLILRKPFKVAHIVPVGSLDVTKNNVYHMCLANIVKKDSRYMAFYRDMASMDDRFVLMDNGAAEGEQLSMDELFQCYKMVQPDEIVLPDTLCNKDDTLEKGKRSLEYIAQHANEYVPKRIMAVPQGRYIGEWVDCMEQMIQWPEISSLGVSKFLQMEDGDAFARYRAVEAIEHAMKKTGRFDIEVHLLGCSERPAIISGIKHQFPFVRGCDSAYGYICTQAGVNVYRMTERPAGEIDFVNGKRYDNLKLNLDNMEVAMDLYENGPDKLWR